MTPFVVVFDPRAGPRSPPSDRGLMVRLQYRCASLVQIGCFSRLVRREPKRLRPPRLSCPPRRLIPCRGPQSRRSGIGARGAARAPTPGGQGLLIRRPRSGQCLVVSSWGRLSGAGRRYWKDTRHCAGGLLRNGAAHAGAFGGQEPFWPGAALPEFDIRQLLVTPSQATM